MFLSVVCVSVGVTIYLFDIGVDLKNYEVFSKIGITVQVMFFSNTSLITLSLAFSEEEFNMTLHYLVVTAAVMGGASLLLELLYAIWE